MIGRVTLWFALATVVALLILAALIGLRREPSKPEVSRGQLFAPLLGAGAFLIILGAKLGIIERIAGAHPYWDQWSEVFGLYQPLVEGRLSWSDILARFGAHRIVFTRLAALGLFDLNQQWDNRLQAVLNAFIHAGTAVWLIVIVVRLRPRLEQWPVAVSVVLLTALPFARENVIWGYQSCFYFLILFALLALRLLTRERSLSPFWWLGLACATACLFTVGSGPLCALAILALTAMDILSAPAKWREQLPNLVGCGGIAVLGAALSHHGTNLNQAATVGDFVRTLGRSAAFPFIDVPWLAPFLWLPFVAWLMVRRKCPQPQLTLERFTTALGFFVFFHIVAIAYARGEGGAPPATRYFDLLTLGFVVNLVACLDLARLSGATVFQSRLVFLGTAAWFVLSGIGYGKLIDQILKHQLAPPSRQERALAMFVRTGQPEAFADKADLVYPSKAALIAFLQDPFVRSILPSSVRVPLYLQPEADSESAFESRPNAKDEEAVGPAQQIISSRWKYETSRKGPFRSREIGDGALPFLRFGLSGFLPANGVSLMLHGRSEKIEVRPQETPGLGWIWTTVRRPRGPFRVVALDERWDGWFGFSAPTEVGSLSLRSEQLLENWWIAFLAGLLLVGLRAVVRASWSLRPSSKRASSVLDHSTPLPPGT